MSAWLILIAAALACFSGVPAALMPARSAAGERIAVALMGLSAATGVAGVGVWWMASLPSRLEAPWPVPGGALAVEVDALSALFLMPVFLVSFLGAVYGLEYWPQSDHPDNGRKLRLCYGLLSASLILQPVARNAILFLFAWEVMALAAFMTVTTDDADKDVQKAGYLYLVSTRAGTLCVFAVFAVLRAVNGNFDFAAPSAISAATADAIFVLAIIGFGLKAGLMPMHVWLPPAHANAPSHVSALMSGVLLKIGLYGLVRVLSFFPSPPTWWGASLLGMGAVSGVLGVAFAIGQHDLKRLLAYHSVENMGIITMGLGLAVLGRSLHRPELVVLGVAGGLLHVWNHGLFKSLLFLSAGSAIHATGTREIDQLGGLAKKMPRTALLFLLGAVAICGLPPLNGFVSELLVYLGLLRALTSAGTELWLAATFGVPALALIGALAAACFIKAFGTVFLGQPRSERVSGAHESGGKMLVPMTVLAGGCVAIGLLPWLLAPVLDAAARAFAPELAPGAPRLAELAPLWQISAAAVALLLLLGACALLLRALVRRGPTREAVTWDCGYAAPEARMQYTSSSFAEMLTGLFGWALRPSIHRPRLEVPFPTRKRFSSHVGDVVLDQAVLPVSRFLGRAFSRLRFLQPGSIHLYIVYVVVAILLGLLWSRGGAR